MTPEALRNNLKEEFKNQDVFSRQELFNFFQKYSPELKETTFRWRIYDLKQKQIIRSVSKDRFSLFYQPAFTPSIDPKTRAAFKEVKKEFPEAKISVWNTKWLNELMLHQPDKCMTIVETESDAVNPVFNHFKDAGYKNVFLEPGKKEIENYVSDAPNPTIISNLITKAPTVLLDTNVIIASLEKILVDIFSDPILFSAFQGYELAVIFENAFKKYDVNATTLYSYASRRGKKEELNKFIVSNTVFPYKSLYD